MIDANSRLSFIVGNSNNRFEIPNVAGQAPVTRSTATRRSTRRRFDAKQNEKNAFQIATYQASPGDKVDYQVSVFHRYTDVAYQPDPLGDLLYGGVAAQVVRRNEAFGVQGDLSYRLGEQHTLRAGLFAQRERYNVDDTSTVFAADDDGGQTSTTPFRIVDDSKGRASRTGCTCRTSGSRSRR